MKSKNKLPGYAKYMNIGFKMLAIILIGVFAGYKIDIWLVSVKFPIAIVVLSLLSVILAIYVVIREL